MTPGARVQAAIEILEAVSAGGSGRGSTPADAVVNSYVRARRYIGSKDRVAITGLVYAVLRHRAQVDWWVERAGEGTPRARQRVLASLPLIRGWAGEQIDGAFDGGKFRPPPLGAAERRLIASLAGHTIAHPEQPDPVRFNCPPWIVPALRERFGDALDTEMQALAVPAPTDLRVNALKGDRAQAAAVLAASGIKTMPTPLSPLGLRVEGRRNVLAHEAFKSGLVEVQDEGSQLAALLVGARPGLRVCDFCAGAGGKSLAMAAAMENKGHIVACDVSGPRLDSAGKRLRRAGVHNVERRHLEGERDGWVKRQAGGFDRVLIDAPCSGTGTWRRNPDARWTLTETDVADLRALQARILASAARLVKPGGRLIYVTCSLLPDENERQAEAFAASSGFAPVPFARVWHDTVGGDCPTSGPWLALSPARHGTDGFFVAVFERPMAA
ncbi:MAG: RsmB/NOP family class I SAM-dependent RNA methyltransferase [Alphaproteobacteria bacterium]|nr:RsmB/NOP family class I SAM-dependent RNA methyltransferase [Alphaproteobacteria bacterium]